MRAFSPVLALALSLVLGGDLVAQEEATQDLEHELRMMVVEPSVVDRDRDVVRAFLGRVDVQAAMAASGVDGERLERRVATLDDGALAELAAEVRSVEPDGDLVGGNTIVLSTSTVIIILLLLILVT